MDVSRQLFEELKREGLGLLRRWVDERRQEDLYLDFKTAQCPMVKGDKQTLAEAVSGFANSEGGIIVWGVYAAKDPDEGVDGALELRPIPDLKVFMSNLHEHTSRLVVPAPEGVQHNEIRDPQGPGAGYAVTLVPKAEGLPHMATAKDQHRYYYRSVDSFLAMEHFMLADRFGRRPQPRLELTHRWERDGDKTYAVFGLRNVGRGIATYPALQIEDQASPDFRVEALDKRFSDDLPGTKAYGLPERVRTLNRPVRAWRTFAGTADDAIHPGTTLDVVKVGWHLAQQSNADWKDIKCRYAAHCEGFSSGEQTYVISADDVRKAAGF